jgi:serine protease Do
VVVRLDDRRVFPANIVARDPQTDLALLQIDAQGLPAATIGDSDAVEVGESVFAIGQAIGLSATVTAGIVSAKGRRNPFAGVARTNDAYMDFIQTDTAINHGNSGGPLINMRGEVIGINAAIRPDAQNVGFAIPTRVARRVMADLRKFGNVQRGWIGMRPIANPQGAELLEGAVVGEITPGGPAAQAGLLVQDVIVAFDDLPVDDGLQLRWMCANAGIGRTVVLRVKRNGKLREVRVKTAAPPSSP